MEYFATLRLPNRTMEILNRCHLYLQAITISDIASACGKYILPAAKTGSTAPIRSSTLQWVFQGRPSKSEWAIWRSTLAHLEEHDRLCQPLGLWLCSTHQQWEYSLQPTTNTLYYRHRDLQYCYQPIVQPNPRTPQQSRPWYDRHRSIPIQGFPSEPLHPVSLEHDSAMTGSLFQVATSPTPIPVPDERQQQEHIGQ